MAPASDKKRSQENDEVTLISEDGVKFSVPTAVANVSPVIRSMLADGDDGMGGVSGGGGGGGEGFAEAETRIVNLLQIRGEVLEVVVEYLKWNHTYKDTKGDADIPRFDSKIPPTLALELLMAADFLDV